METKEFKFGYWLYNGLSELSMTDTYTDIYKIKVLDPLKVNMQYSL
jgi:hypothetical protein